MLRTVILMNSLSGLVVFSREFVNGIAQPRLIGSLLTAMMEFGMATTGTSVAYIELANLAVTIRTHEDTHVLCALFHDREDGSSFGKLVCGQILETFVREYSADLGRTGLNLRDFHGFHGKIAEVFRGAVRPVLAKLQGHRGVHRALLVMDGTVISPSADVDQLAVLANLSALTALCSDIMTHIDDDCSYTMLDTAQGSRLLLWRIPQQGGALPQQGSTQSSFVLIVLVSRGVAATRYRPAIEEGLSTLNKLLNELQLVSR